jgi:adenosylcobinamide kinase / adenosylcobinamide-phosphate guanylyltransferase
LNTASASDSQGAIVLILGGVRSGKSRFGESLATELASSRTPSEVLYVATAEPRDDEMSRRIRIHRASRPSSWQTMEQPLGVGRQLSQLEHPPRVVLLDCLTLLVSNVMLQSGDELSESRQAQDAEERVRTEIDELVRITKQCGFTLVIVSGEVGMGIVPESKLGRLFRDLLGWANQELSRHADATYLMVAGHAINVASVSTSVQSAAREIERS